MELRTDVFSIFDKKWALLTAGDMDKFNTMTISWGGLGTLWNKPVATVYVRTSRYTHEFMDDKEYFTVSFYPESYRKALGELGSKSGRDIDKMHYEGLSAEKAGETEAVTFKEAELTLVCKKLFKEHISVDKIPSDVFEVLYKNDAPHDLYIAEVVDIIEQLNPEAAVEEIYKMDMQTYDTDDANHIVTYYVHKLQKR